MTRRLLLCGVVIGSFLLMHDQAHAQNRGRMTQRSMVNLPAMPRVGTGVGNIARPNVRQRFGNNRNNFGTTGFQTGMAGIQPGGSFGRSGFGVNPGFGGNVVNNLNPGFAGAGFAGGGALPYLNLRRGGSQQLNYYGLVQPQLQQNNFVQQQQAFGQQLQNEIDLQQAEIQQVEGEEADVFGTSGLPIGRKPIEQGLQPQFLNTGGFFPGLRY